METRTYGPHHEADEPRTVTVFARHRDGGDKQEPIPEVILRQRRTLNERAHKVVGGPALWRKHFEDSRG